MKVTRGRLIRLVPGDEPSKMACLTERDTIQGTLDDFEKGQKELDAEMRAAWDQKWATRL